MHPTLFPLATHQIIVQAPEFASVIPSPNGSGRHD
jgi:hypothetical protein